MHVSITLFLWSYNRSVTYWFFSSEVIALSSWGWFIRDTYIRSKFANKYVRRSVGAVLVIFPILSYSSGKIDSVKILNNDEVRVFAFQEDSTKKNKDTLKIISLLNDKIIASSLNNKKIYILNQSVAAKIELFDLSPVLGKKTIKPTGSRSIMIKN